MSYLLHYGIKGQKWGIRRFENVDGTLTNVGKKRYYGSRSKYKASDNVFVSGKVKYDEPLSGKIKDEVDKIVKANSKILIGVAPGADTRVQEYLSQIGYKNVEVYTTDGDARNNVGNWIVNKIDASKYSDEREARRQKDIAMTNASNKGLAISSKDDRLDSATSLNIQRMRDKGSKMTVYDYKKGTFLKTPKSESEKDSRYVQRTIDDVENIFSSFSKKDKKLLGAGDDDTEYMSREAHSYWVSKRFLAKEGNTPVAFLDIIKSGNGEANIAIGTHANYRGKGYASRVALKGAKWIEEHPDAFMKVNWGAYDENVASINLAKKNGFKLERSENGFSTYSRKG